ncbi:MAG: hypothetical protein ACKO6N_25305 [Myxococcota bacterium]
MRRQRGPSLGVFLLSLTLSACTSGDLFEPLPEEVGIIGVSLGNVAVVTGDNERIEELLTRFEVPYTLYDGFNVGPPADALLAEAYTDLPPVESLLVPSTLVNYSVVFINCGARGFGDIDLNTLQPDISLLSAEHVQTLSDFVNRGGELILSDRSFPLVERLAADQLSFYGDDASLTEPLVGAPGTVQAEVVDQALSEDLGRTSLWMEYLLQGWAVVESGSGVLLSGDIELQPSPELPVERRQEVPLLLRFAVGSGYVTYATFHNAPEIDPALTDLQIHLLRRIGGVE